MRKFFFCFLLAFVPPAFAQVSSNKMLVVGTNNVLRADATNFFDTNILYMTNALVKVGFSTGVAGGAGGPDTRPLSGVVSIWGDSLSDGGGTGGPWGLLMTNFIPSAIPDINAYSGEGSSYISNQFLLAPAQWSNVTVLWAGRNDNLTVAANANVTIANLNYMATNVARSNLIVLGILVSTNDTQATIAIITNLNNSLSNIYWPRYIDVENMLMSNNNGGAEDLAYIANHWTPASLLSSTDPLHLNATGYNMVASNVCLVISNLFLTNSVRESSLPGIVSNMVASTNIPHLQSAGAVIASSVANIPAFVAQSVAGSATAIQINGPDTTQWAIYNATWATGISFRDQANGIIPLVLNDGGVFTSNLTATNFHFFGTNTYTNGTFGIVEHISTTSGEMVLTPSVGSTNTLGIDVGTNLGGAGGGYPLVIRTNKSDVWHVDAAGDTVMSGNLTAGSQANAGTFIAASAVQGPQFANASSAFTIGNGATPSITVQTASSAGNVSIGGNLLVSGTNNFQYHTPTSITLTTNSSGPDVGKIVVSNLYSPDGRWFSNEIVIRYDQVTNPVAATIKFTNQPGPLDRDIHIWWESTNGMNPNLFVTNNCNAPNAGALAALTNGVALIDAITSSGLSGSWTNVTVNVIPQLGNVGNQNNYSMFGR